MAKRIKYKIGDIVLVPVTENEKIPARILKQQGGSVLLEVFDCNTVSSKEEFDFDTIKEEKAVYFSWCYDNVIRNGEWEIIADKEVEDFPEVYFWTEDVSGEYYLVNGNDALLGEVVGKIAKEDRDKYFPYGISNEYSLPDKINMRLAKKKDSK